MPTRLILTGGNEMVVADPYAVVLGAIEEERTYEATCLHWNNPDSPGFDEDAPAPLYSESLITIRCAAVVAIEREEPWLAEIIEKCKRLQAEA